MENLCLPALRNQSSFMWMIPLSHEHVGRPFSELFEALSKEKALPIALLRAKGTYDNSMPYLRSYPPGDLKLHALDQEEVKGSSSDAKEAATPPA
eukprot:1001219-Prorocentrum_minimum.AAC.2